MFIGYWRVGGMEFVRSNDLLSFVRETIYDTICERKVVTVLVLFGKFRLVEFDQLSVLNR